MFDNGRPSEGSRMKMRESERAKSGRENERFELSGQDWAMRRGCNGVGGAEQKWLNKLPPGDCAGVT